MLKLRAWWALANLVVAAGCARPVARGPDAPAPVAPLGSQPQASLISVPDDPNAVSVSSNIRKVTVYSDRALVSREGAVKLAAGAKVYAFRHLPGWVDEGSVRVASSGGRILDVRVVRSYLARSTQQSYVAADASLRELSGRLASLDDESAVLEAQAKQIENIKTFSLERLNHDTLNPSPPAANQASIGNVGVNTYAAVVDFIGDKLRDVSRGRRAVKSERERLVPEVEAAKKRLEDLRALAKLEETSVLVTLQSAAELDADLQVTYMLPGATWEAAHEFRASDGEASSVEVTSYAVVTQASGEDWDHAELSFSTQSSTAAVRIPELEALTLGDTRPAAQTVETRSASFKRAEAAF